MIVARPSVLFGHEGAPQPQAPALGRRTPIYAGLAPLPTGGLAPGPCAGRARQAHLSGDFLNLPSIWIVENALAQINTIGRILRGNN